MGGSRRALIPYQPSVTSIIAAPFLLSILLLLGDTAAFSDMILETHSTSVLPAASSLSVIFLIADRLLLSISRSYLQKRSRDTVKVNKIRHIVSP